jgi:hypothetical protein
MATRAALSLYRHMLVNEGSLLLGMAFVANRISARKGAQLTYRLRPVKVVAVITCY